jgi:hypothetical protein
MYKGISRGKWPCTLEHFGIPESSGRRILKNGLHHREGVEETRGRRPKRSEIDIQKIEKLLYDGGLEARSLRWDALPRAAGLDTDVSGWTVRRYLHQKDWRKCIACTRS